MAGRWRLSLAAKVQSEDGTVDQKLVIKGGRMMVSSGLDPAGTTMSRLANPDGRPCHGRCRLLASAPIRSSSRRTSIRRWPSLHATLTAHRQQEARRPILSRPPIIATRTGRPSTRRRRGRRRTAETSSPSMQPGDVRFAASGTIAADAETAAAAPDKPSKDQILSQSHGPSGHLAGTDEGQHGDGLPARIRGQRRRCQHRHGLAGDACKRRACARRPPR